MSDNPIQDFGDSLPPEQRARWFELNRCLFRSQCDEYDLNHLRRDPCKYVVTRWEWPSEYFVEVTEAFEAVPAFCVTLIKSRQQGRQEYVPTERARYSPKRRVNPEDTLNVRWVPDVPESRYRQRITWHEYHGKNGDRSMNDRFGLMCHCFGVEAPKLRSDAEVLELIRNGDV